MAATVNIDRLDFVWLEITGRCQLRCAHCYADSGPEGNHGTVTPGDWRRVIDEAGKLGVREAQFIGGEPTLYPELPELVCHALDRGLTVEIYSNLARPLPEEVWALFDTPGVRLATSYYATDARTHEAITSGSAGSHRRTRANIIEALRRSIPLRVSIVKVQENQDVEQARTELESLGVEHISVDRLQQVGRGVRDLEPSTDQLCGRCADGVLAVSPDGDVWPCVFSRWLRLGNIHNVSLVAIWQDSATAQVRAELAATFAIRAGKGDKCPPKDNPQCPPNFEKPDCPPRGSPDGKCPPKGGGR